jgi:hypothetical protein
MNVNTTDFNDVLIIFVRHYEDENIPDNAVAHEKFGFHDNGIEVRTVQRDLVNVLRAADRTFLATPYGLFGWNDPYKKQKRMLGPEWVTKNATSIKAQAKRLGIKNIIYNGDTGIDNDTVNLKTKLRHMGFYVDYVNPEFLYEDEHVALYRGLLRDVVKRMENGYGVPGRPRRQVDTMQLADYLWSAAVDVVSKAYGDGECVRRVAKPMRGRMAESIAKMLDEIVDGSGHCS